MKAMVPDGKSSVRVDDVPAPELSAGDVLITVEAYSVNRGETFLLEAPPPGWRPGKDVAGRVATAAANGVGPAPGTRVVAHAPASGWAEYVSVPVSSLAVLPNEVPTEAAAALPLAGLTALRLLRLVGPLVGRRLLVTGASGGVGHYLVELAAAGGADITAVSATLERGARLRDFGARTVTSVEDADEWFDVALESVGGASFTAARNKVKPEGKVIWFGQASKEPVTISFFDWAQGTVRAPIIPFDYTKSDHSDGEDLATLVRLVQQGRLHPEIGASRPWGQTSELIDDIRARRLRGNAVLVVA